MEGDCMSSRFKMCYCFYFHSAKPKGPEEVTVEDIRANSCRIEWTPPKNDGGSPVTGYAVEMCDESTGIWTPVTGKIKANSVEVPNLTEGHRYNFRVSAINDLGRSEPTETLLSIVAKNPFGMRLFIYFVSFKT